MTRLLCAFWSDDYAQDLIEYTLVTGFVGIVAAVLFMNAGASTSGVWAIADQQLKNDALIRLSNTHR